MLNRKRLGDAVRRWKLAGNQRKTSQNLLQRTSLPPKLGEKCQEPKTQINKRLFSELFLCQVSGGARRGFWSTVRPKPVMPRGKATQNTSLLTPYVPLSSDDAANESRHLPRSQFDVWQCGTEIKSRCLPTYMFWCLTICHTKVSENCLGEKFQNRWPPHDDGSWSILSIIVLRGVIVLCLN